MDILIELILRAGRSAVELALFVLLPIMVVMLSFMRLLEARGVLDWLVAKLAPVLRPFGLTGLGVFAALQINFVSFAAPIATLTMMESRGASNRHLAATLAMVLAMPQANTSLPLAAFGLQLGPVFLLSLLGGLLAAAITYYGFGRHLDNREQDVDETLHHPVAESAKGVLDVIAIGAIPMLVLALVAVAALRTSGVFDLLAGLLAPAIQALHLDPAWILPTLTKYIAGGSAMMAVVDEMLRSGMTTVGAMNHAAGFLVHPFDIPGIAILISAGRRVAAVWRPAAMGAIVGIALRSVGHLLID
jgi:spore maturation protein SpmB